jgi:L-Lysine epsilon oxidase N-terminal/L-lysine epsilon oxidase C-terminal domain
VTTRHRHHTYRIHPSIGIARLGDSELGYFLGPELPGVPPLPRAGTGEQSFRDSGIKRQAVRFRVYEYEVGGNGQYSVVRELTLDEPDVANIRWTVHLANTKASFQRFEGALGDPTAMPPLTPMGTPPPRNPTIKGEDDRKRRLEINPCARSISGRGVTAGAAFTPSASSSHETWPTVDDTPGGAKVIDYLGELQTDETGRLLVLGGHGKSGHGVRGGPLVDANFANYDGWYDDVSDGPVSAEIHFRHGGQVQVGGWTERACLDGQPLSDDGGAWVVVAPPKFAPHLDPVISLYDRMLDVAVKSLALDGNRAYDVAGSALWRLKQLKTDPGYRPSFTHEIQPILRRAFESGFVFGEAASKHYSIAPEVWAILADPNQLPDARGFIFRYLRPPSGVAVPDGWMASMPMLFGDQFWGDRFGGTEAPDGEFLSLTASQYEILRRWSEGHFAGDWNDEPAPPDAAVTADGLDRAALQAAIGGAFFPGIEVSWLIRDPSVYVAPFRIKHHETIVAGHFTRQMALPWQADFFDCSKDTVTYNTSAADPALQSTDVMTWWPTHRPDDVLTRGASDRVSWARDSDGTEIDTKEKFLAEWRRLGFVVDTAGDHSRFEEVDRSEPGRGRRATSRKTTSS